MKDLIKQYLDNGLSRRQLMTGLSTMGLSTVAAKSVAQSLETFGQGAAAPPAAVRQVKGTGGALFVQQLKAAGVQYVFFNPATSDYPIFDALVDEPDIKLIKGIHEGAVVAMADGYARASGKTGVVIVANIGLPNAMTQMVNSWKDQIPILVAAASVEQDALGRDLFQETDHVESMTQPITKWHWLAQTTAAIPETLRRGMKFASTSPCGPVFLSLPTNTLRAEATAAIWDQAKFDVPMRIRPDKDDITKAARLLIEAKNPLMSVGDEATWCRAGKELVELAELLGLPVTGQAGSLGFWSRPFPTRHPLYIGPQLRDMRYPGKPDVLLNLGNKYGERAAPGTTLISIRLDPTSLARGAPVDLGIVADLRLAVADLVAAVRGMATEARLKQIADERSIKTRAYTAEMREFRQKIAHENAEPHAGQPRAHRARARGRARQGHLLRGRRRFRQDHGSPDVLRRRRQALHRHRAERAGMGPGGGVRRQARAPGRAGGLGRRRRQLLLLRPAAALDAGTLQRAGHEHRAQQPQLQQRAQPHLALRRPAVQDRPRHDLLPRQPGHRLRQGVGSLRGRGRSGEGALQAQRCDRARQTRRRGRTALSAGRPHLSRRRRRRFHLASAILGRGPALTESVMKRLLLAFSLAGALVAAATPLQAQTAAALPQGEARDLVAVACSQCHSLAVLTAVRDGPVGWKRHVYNMVLRGAQLTPREADTVIQYLITHFGPGAPMASAAALPSGPGKDLVETRCAVCHDLERVTIVKRQKRDWETIVASMYERWGMSAPDEERTINAYLITQFGRE